MTATACMISGILALPIFIIIGTLMLGKRTAPYFAVAAIVVVSGVVLLEGAGYVQPTIRPATLENLVPIILLLAAAAAVTWIIIGVVERNLQRARESESEVRRSYDQTLEAWARILEHRDRETQGHTEQARDEDGGAACAADGPDGAEPCRRAPRGHASRYRQAGGAGCHPAEAR